MEGHGAEAKRRRMRNSCMGRASVADVGLTEQACVSLGCCVDDSLNGFARTASALLGRSISTVGGSGLRLLLGTTSTSLGGGGSSFGFVHVFVLFGIGMEIGWQRLARTAPSLLRRRDSSFSFNLRIFGATSTSLSSSVAGSDLRGRPLAFFGAASASSSSSASSSTGAAFFGRPLAFFAGASSSSSASAAFLPRAFFAAGLADSSSSSSSSAASVLAGRPRFLPVDFFEPPSSARWELLASCD
jgi:hypothetical protein